MKQVLDSYVLRVKLGNSGSLLKWGPRVLQPNFPQMRVTFSPVTPSYL
jgi:hypothetical protein